MNLNFILIVLKQINVAAVVIIFMIHILKSCVPDVTKNTNVKAFNLMSRTNETRPKKWYETCKGKCRLDTSVCNNKQR